MRFVRQSIIAASAETVFAFHERPDAFARLTPPWQQVEIIQPPTSLAIGTRVIVRAKLGPLWRRMVFEHVEYEPGHRFADRMIEGPFKAWLHRHIVTPRAARECTLTDDIELELPGFAIGRLVGGPIARRQLDRLFDFRHAVTRAACE